MYISPDIHRVPPHAAPLHVRPKRTKCKLWAQGTTSWYLVVQERVVGQDDAVDATARAMRRARSGIKDPQRPIAAMLFAGPTGVGKTELTKVWSCRFGCQHYPGITHVDFIVAHPLVRSAGGGASALWVKL